MTTSRAAAESRTVLRQSRCSASRSVSSTSCVMPSTPFMGVRISWLMLARNSLFSREASWARRSRSTISPFCFSTSSILQVQLPGSFAHGVFQRAALPAGFVHAGTYQQRDNPGQRDRNDSAKPPCLPPRWNDAEGDRGRFLAPFTPAVPRSDLKTVCAGRQTGISNLAELGDCPTFVQPHQAVAEALILFTEETEARVGNEEIMVLVGDLGKRRWIANPVAESYRRDGGRWRLWNLWPSLRLEAGKTLQRADPDGPVRFRPKSVRRTVVPDKSILVGVDNPLSRGLHRHAGVRAGPQASLNVQAQKQNVVRGQAVFFGYVSHLYCTAGHPQPRQTEGFAVGHPDGSIAGLRDVRDGIDSQTVGGGQAHPRAAIPAKQAVAAAHPNPPLGIPKEAEIHGVFARAGRALALESQMRPHVGAAEESACRCSPKSDFRYPHRAR